MAMNADMRPVRIEALGDDFALVEGAWLQSERIARYLANADGLWAFFAPDRENIDLLIADLSARTGKRVVGLSPGKRSGWPAEQAELLRAMFAPPPPLEACVGLLMTLPQPACACPHRQSGCPGKCGGCSGTNTSPRALDHCNNTSP